MILVDSLKVKYNDFCAVDNISFSVYEQEIFGIIGPNGAGKTSAIECIEGLRKPHSGKIRVLGLEPWKERKKLHEKIGVQLQYTAYQDRARVAEICELFSSLYSNPRPYASLLEMMDLADKKRAFVSQLSGGQKQKLSIVLALISNPTLVFLDEITTGLDPRARHQMWDMLLRLRGQGLTIVLVSHYMDEVEAICDRVAIMNKGRIFNIGTVNDVIRQYDLKEQISFTSSLSDLDGLEKLSNVASVKKDQEKITIFGDGDDWVVDILRYLEDNNIEYAHFTIKKPDLETVFLNLTGYALAEDNCSGRQVGRG